MHDQPIRKSLSFAQAEGRAELPRQLELREVSPELRARTWALLNAAISENQIHVAYEHALLSARWQNVMTNWHVRVRHRMVDELSLTYVTQAAYIKRIIAQGDYSELFTFLEFLLRARDVTSAVKVAIARLLVETRSSYRVIDEDTIVPFGTGAEAAALQSALEATNASGFGGARAHLVLAAQALSGGEWADSVRESIHAVESAAVRLAPNTKELGPALGEIEKRGRLPGALKEAFKKLYGFTSNDEGIRHALVFKDTATVDEADAMFMLGACASFVTYLVQRGESQ